MSKQIYAVFVCVWCFKIDDCILKQKKATQKLPPYLWHLTLTHLVLHAGVILCCFIQMSAFEIKDVSPLAWCLGHSFSFL